MSGIRTVEGEGAAMRLTVFFLNSNFSEQNSNGCNERAMELLERMATGVGLTPNQWAEILFCEENPGSKRLT
jgi:hypothetical protein